MQGTPVPISFTITFPYSDLGFNTTAVALNFVVKVIVLERFAPARLNMSTVWTPKEGSNPIRVIMRVCKLPISYILSGSSIDGDS